MIDPKARKDKNEMSMKPSQFKYLVVQEAPPVH